MLLAGPLLTPLPLPTPTLAAHPHLPAVPADAVLPAWMKNGGVVPGASAGGGSAAPAPAPVAGSKRSRSRSYERRRSRSRSYDRGRYRSRSRSPPLPVSAAIAARVAPVAGADPRALIQVAMANATVGAASSDMVRRAKRLYVGNIPPTTDAELAKCVPAARQREGARR